MIQENNLIKIGQLAQILDKEYSMLERMKIKKNSLKRLAYAFAVYIVIMILFTLIL
jgi:hypothetical protein